MCFLKACAVILVGSIVWITLKKNKEDVSGNRSSKHPISKQDQFSVIAKKDLGAGPTARMIMRREISHFADLLEPLYSVSLGRLQKIEALAILNEWDTEMKTLKDADKLVKKWDVLTEGFKEAEADVLNNIASLWINQMASFGICRDDKDAVQINERVKHAYVADDGQPLVLNEYMLIKKGAWFSDTDIVCKGILKKEDKNG